MGNAIAPSPSEAVAVYIRSLQQLTLDIDAALRGRYLPATPRDRLAFGCLDLAVEHQSGIAVLADQPLWGPTFALLRIQFEAFIRGVWLARCAADDQLAWFVDGKPGVDSGAAVRRSDRAARGYRDAEPFRPPRNSSVTQGDD
jgi:hypothetical protein